MSLGGAKYCGDLFFSLSICTSGVVDDVMFHTIAKGPIKHDVILYDVLPFGLRVMQADRKTDILITILRNPPGGKYLLENAWQSVACNPPGIGMSSLLAMVVKQN